MVVGQAQPELSVDLGFVGRIGLPQQGQQAAEGVHDDADLITAHAPGEPAWEIDSGERGFGCRPLGLYLAAPGSDERRVCPCLQGGAAPGCDSSTAVSACSMRAGVKFWDSQAS
ncbi:MAG: hypothetical protein QOF84_5697, partial [Streptomyces sp.]|nr:hypothetical protein [Streptomyces sp.]